MINAPNTDPNDRYAGFKNLGKGLGKGAEAAFEVFRRGEAGLVNPILGVINNDKEGILKNISKGLSGKELSSIGDLIRQPLYNTSLPPAAVEATAGGLGMLGAGKVAGLVGKGVGMASKTIPKLFAGDKWKVANVKEAVSGIDDILREAKENYDIVFSSVKDKPIRTTTINQAVKDIPKIIKDRFANTKGKLKVTIDDINKWRQDLNMETKDGTWITMAKGKNPSISQKHITELEDTLKKIVKDNVDDDIKAGIKEADAHYSAVVDKAKSLKKKLYDFNTGTVKTKGIYSEWTNPNASQDRETFKEMAKQSDKLSKFVVNMEKYNKGIKTKKMLVDAAKVAAIAGVGGGALGIGGYYGIKALGNQLK
jgi:hypothetical protein